jgi:hypothetical protein
MYGHEEFAAGYFDLNRKQIFYAEGGRSGSRSSEGVYWYPCREDAEEALRKVISVSNALHATSY